METLQIIEISEDLKAHLQLNSSQEVYRNIPSEFKKVDNKYGIFIEWDKIKDYQLTEPKKNLELIKARIEARAKRTNILAGDVIRYKDGKEERVTYVWDDSAQAGGGSGSYYMNNNGGASYSGGLNLGLPLNKLQLTNETKPTLFWFFSNDWTGAHRGVYFYCPVKVWIEK